jgi:hypothetical protein
MKEIIDRDFDREVIETPAGKCGSRRGADKQCLDA